MNITVKYAGRVYNSGTRNRRRLGQIIMKEEKEKILKTNLKQLAENWVWFIVLSFIMTLNKSIRRF